MNLDQARRAIEASAEIIRLERKIETLLAEGRAKDAVIEIAEEIIEVWVPWKGDKLPSTFGVSVSNLVRLAGALTVLDSAAGKQG